MGLELHFHEPIVSFDRGASASETASDASASEAGTTAAASETEPTSRGGGGAALGALLALAVLVGLAYAVRKARGGDDASPESEEAEIEIDE
jgi:hypothetical protein